MAVGEVNPLATRTAVRPGRARLRLWSRCASPRTCSTAGRGRWRHCSCSPAPPCSTKGTLGEIDATLCLVVAAALKVWWDGNRPEGQTLASWIAVGLLLGLAGLLKGPAGPAIFYLTIGPFLVWQRRWTRLLHRGPLDLCAFSWCCRRPRGSRFYLVGEL